MAVRVSLAQKNKSRGIKIWYARVFNPETRELRYVSLGTDRKVEAQAVLSGKLAAGEFEEREPERMTLGEALDRFMKKKEQETSPKNVTFYRFTLVNPLSGLRSREVRTIATEEVLEAISTGKRGELSARAYNARMTAVKGLFRFLSLDLDLNVKDPLRRVKKKKSVPKYEKFFWTSEQVDAILDRAPTPAVRLFLAFMAFAGLREFEARKLKRDDIDGDFFSVVGKGGKFARLPLGPRMKAEIARYGDGPWDFSRIRFYLGKFVKMAEAAIPEGFKGNANFHRLRHSFGSNLIRAGVNVKAVQVLMRHSNIQITLNVYSHLLDEDLFKALEKLK